MEAWVYAVIALAALAVCGAGTAVYFCFFRAKARVVLKAPMPVSVAMSSSADGELQRGPSATEIFDNVAEKEEKL